VGESAQVVVQAAVGLGGMRGVVLVELYRDDLFFFLRLGQWMAEVSVLCM
jgi:uncharacterized alpha-E superfamily protein